MVRWRAWMTVIGVAIGLSGLRVPAADKPAPYAPASPTAELGGEAGRSDAGSTFPIDLPTVLRLVNAQSPAIGYAQARLAEAIAVRDRADLLILPNLTAGANYYRLDGQTQNQRGEVFGVSRANLFSGGALQLRLNASDAYFQPLIARRLVSAASANAQAVTLAAEYDAVSAYLDLLQVHAALAVNADTLARTEQMVAAARAADAAGVSRTKADINRALTELYQRRQERGELVGRYGAASARLVRLLLLEPATELTPSDPAIVPTTLVPPERSLEQLIATALASRPDLAAERALVQSAIERERLARIGPWTPKAALEYQIGAFGGGRNSDLNDFSSRSVAGAQVYWELNSLGFGDAAVVRERRAQLAQAQFRLADACARAGAEVAEAARIAAASFSTLDNAQTAIREALEMYRKLQESSLNLVGERSFDSIEPLLAIQALNAARLRYLAAVIEFNRAQFRLFTALGEPADVGLSNAATTPVAVPVLPALPPVK